MQTSRHAPAPTDEMVQEVHAAEDEGRSAIVNEDSFNNLTPDERKYIRELAAFRGVPLMLGK